MTDGPMGIELVNSYLFADILPTNCLASDSTARHSQIQNARRREIQKDVTSYGIIRGDVRLLTFNQGVRGSNPRRLTKTK